MTSSQTGLACVLAIAVASCSGSRPSPTAPTPTVPPPATASSPATSSAEPLPEQHIVGFVRDEDNSPVGGAAVTIGQSGAVVTNDDGSFDLVWHTSNPQYGVFITVAKVAYESTMAYSDSLKEVGKRTFRLFRPRFITVGDSITLELSADNSLCGLEGEWTCRGVRVTSGSVGVLKAAVGTDDDWASFELANAIQYPYKASTTLAIPVRAGSVTTLWVLGAWNMKRPGLFTLTTTLER